MLFLNIYQASTLMLINISSLIEQNKVIDKRNYMSTNETLPINTTFNSNIDMNFNRIQFLSPGFQDYDAVNQRQLNFVKYEIDQLKNDKLKYFYTVSELKFQERFDNNQIIEVTERKFPDAILTYNMFFKAIPKKYSENVSIHWFPISKIPYAMLILRTFENIKNNKILIPELKLILLITDVNKFIQEFTSSYFLTILYYVE